MAEDSPRDTLNAERDKLRDQARRLYAQKLEIDAQLARLANQWDALAAEGKTLLSQNLGTNPNLERDSLAFGEKTKQHKTVAEACSENAEAWHKEWIALEEQTDTWAERYVQLSSNLGRINSAPLPAKEPGYYLIFCGRDKHFDRVPPTLGHAFVAWAQDDEHQQACIIEAFGFYPGSNLGGIFSLIRPVDGKVANQEFKKADGDYMCKVTARVSKDVFLATQELRAVWQDEKYQIRGQNCISFADAVAKRAGLKTPPRFKDQFPTDYVNQLSKLNGK